MTFSFTTYVQKNFNEGLFIVMCIVVTYFVFKRKDVIVIAICSRNFREIGGQIYPGEVNEKVAAQKKYDAAKKKGQSAGQVKQKQAIIFTRHL